MKYVGLFFIIWIILSFGYLAIFYGLGIIDIKIMYNNIGVEMNPFKVIAEMANTAIVNWEANLIMLFTLLISLGFTEIIYQSQNKKAN